MKSNSRLSLALHTLAHMAQEPGQKRISADIAAHAGTNPVVVRRVLGRLRDAGLVVSEKGHAGGWRLARAPQDITLADVYLALGEHLIGTSEADTPSDCTVAHALHRRVAQVLEDAEQEVVRRMGEITILDIGAP